MADPNVGEVTLLLRAWRDGDKAALDKLLPLVYDELCRIARQKYHQFGPQGTLQPTALVNEAYLRLVDEKSVDWQNRAHFYAIAANTIRRILIEDYRRRSAQKRGGKEVERVSLSGIEAPVDIPLIDFIALNEALEDLVTLDEQQARIVELRFFSDLSNEEIAAVLNISLATVKREWRSAKAWLYSRLSNK